MHCAFLEKTDPSYLFHRCHTLPSPLSRLFLWNYSNFSARARHTWPFFDRDLIQSAMREVNWLCPRPLAIRHATCNPTHYPQSGER